MKYWKYYTIGSGLALLTGYVLSNPLLFGICNRIYSFNDQLGCLDWSISAVGEPLLIFSAIIFLFLISFLFIRERAFLPWLWFALWWLPLSMIVIYVASSGENSWMPLYSHSQGEVALFMASLFTIISLGIIAYKQFNLGKNSK